MTVYSGRLGVGEYRVLIGPRGGGLSIGELSTVSGSWSRVLDDTSSAKVTAQISGSSDRACCQLLGKARSVEYELSIVRSDREAWVGPITEIEYGYDQVTVSARDVSWWFSQRVLHTDHAYDGVELATIFTNFAADALAADPVGITVIATATGLVGKREIAANDAVVAWDAMRELLRTGVDLTVVGRQVLVGGEEVNATRVVALTDEYFTVPPTISESGENAATKVYVRGGTNSVTGAQILGTYGGIDAAFGLVELSVFEPSILDQVSADQNARTRWDLLRTPPLVLSGGTLSPYAPVTMERLVPGALVSVALDGTCRTVAQDFRLQRVEIDFNAEGESVRPTLQPIGST